MRWTCRDVVFEFTQHPLVMGILNVTPDSFSDGGRYAAPAAAVARARDMVAEGADLIDIGAESTRPGSLPVPAEEQWRRLKPVLAGIAGMPGACISVDTASAEVARRALAAGARVVNDVTGLGDPEMPGVVAESGAGVVLMHMRGVPATMQRDPRYTDAAEEIGNWLGRRMDAVLGAGVSRDAIALDPGIGFGKALEHNLRILARIDRIVALGRPVLVGLSRKSFLGRLLDDAPVEGRLEAGLAAAAIAVQAGAAIVRTHDVAATVRAVRVAAAIRAAGAAPATTDPA